MPPAPHPLVQLLAAFEPVPERLRRHAHDQVIGLAGHDVVDRAKHLLADVVHELIEVGVVADRIVGNMDATEVIGDAARPHRFELRLHGGIGRRRNYAEFLAEAERVGHGAKLCRRSQAKDNGRARDRVANCRGARRRVDRSRPARDMLEL